MTTAADTRLLYAAIFTLLTGILFYGLTDGAGMGALSTPSVAFGGSGERVSVTAAEGSAALDALAHVPACEAGDVRTGCIGLTAPGAAPVVGRIASQVGTADGRLAAGGLDRFTLHGAAGVSRIHLEGDVGTSLGVYVAGVALVDPGDGRSSIADLRLPADGVLVQIAVLNGTDAPRSYRIVVG